MKHRRTAPWRPDEYLIIEGIQYTYTITEDEIMVNVPGQLPIPLGVLKARHLTIENPKLWRGEQINREPELERERERIKEYRRQKRIALEADRARAESRRKLRESAPARNISTAEWLRKRKEQQQGQEFKLVA